MAGRVSYELTRSAPRVFQREGQLVISTEVSGPVQVCKPLGPFCPVYGRCQPVVQATVAVGLGLDGAYRPGPVSASLQATRGCVLRPVGLDVSDRLPPILRRQQSALVRQIASRLPELRPAAEGLWAVLTRSVPLGPDSCIVLDPRRVLTRAEGSSDERVAVQVGVEGTVRLHSPCLAPAETTRRSLPLPRRGDDLPRGLRLRVPIAVGSDRVRAELERSLAAPESVDDPRDWTVTAVRVVPARVGADARLVLGLTVRGPGCGTLWVSASPGWDAERQRIQLREVRALTTPVGAGADRVGELSRWVERRASIALPVDLDAAPSRLEALAHDLEELTGAREYGASVEIEVQPPAVEALHVTAEGLVAVASIRGPLLLAAR